MRNEKKIYGTQIQILEKKDKNSRRIRKNRKKIFKLENNQDRNGIYGSITNQSNLCYLLFCLPYCKLRNLGIIQSPLIFILICQASCQN